MLIPAYYRMTDDLNVIDWILTLPPPAVPESQKEAIGELYANAALYMRRCLWKGPTVAHMAEDVRLAIRCLTRLAEVLDAAAQEDTP